MNFEKKTAEGFRYGDHVRLMPHADLWVRGVGNSVGVVEVVGRKYLRVRFHGWTPFRFPLDRAADVLARCDRHGRLLEREP